VCACVCVRESVLCEWCDTELPQDKYMCKCVCVCERVFCVCVCCVNGVMRDCPQTSVCVCERETESVCLCVCVLCEWRNTGLPEDKCMRVCV